jgi:hypothetical protein
MAEPRKEEGRKQHLYLLFDDWDSGYSIRKVSLSRRSDKRAKEPLSSGSDKQGVEPLPQVFMHIQARRGLPHLFTSAFDAKIMVMHPFKIDETKGIPMIDVQKQALTFGPLPRSANFLPIYLPVGCNRLFILDIGSFDCYLWAPEHSEEPWEWQILPYPPFRRADVSSYGVHPDGYILVSTIGEARTFILDTTKEDYVWKPYSSSVLPFSGRGHYDTSLGGFVGLSRDGYLCCRTMAASTTGTNPHDKRTNVKVYTERQHVSATLVHIHPRKFCLVECVSVDSRRTGQDLRESWAREFKMPLGSRPWFCVGGGPQGGRCMYHIKTFTLTYDSEADCLKLKNCKGQGCCYSLPHEARIGSVCMDPVAFWL